MKAKINKTNAVRLLDKAKIDYELIPYEVDENDLAAAHVAAQLGENIEQVFKTLVLHGDRGGYFVCVIPGDHELDLKGAESGFDPDEGIIAYYRVHPGRLLAYRDEKRVPHVYSRKLFKVRIHLYQCGCSGITNPAKPERFNHLYPGDVDKLKVKK